MWIGPFTPSKHIRNYGTIYTIFENFLHTQNCIAMGKYNLQELLAYSELYP